MSVNFDLDNAIRKINDFPKKGITFYDITSVLTNPDAFGYCIDKMIEIYSGKQIDAVAAVEARGFIFAAPFCEKMGIPLILIRKKGKLPGKTLSKTYDLEYGKDTIEMHEADLPKNANILLVDDLIATGGTLRAAEELIKTNQSEVIGAFGIIGLPFLNYSEVLKGIEIKTLINYNCE